MASSGRLSSLFKKFPDRVSATKNYTTIANSNRNYFEYSFLLDSSSNNDKLLSMKNSIDTLN